MNMAILIGKIGQDPKLTFTSSGNPVCQFSMATSEKYTKDGQKQEKTEWHNIVIWGKIAEVCNQYLKKGSKVMIEGKIQTRTWDDKDGKKCYKTEINASQVEFLDSKPKAQGDESFAGDDINF